MKKNLYLLSLLISIISCKSYNDFMSIENQYYLEKKDSLIDGKYLNVKINGKNLKMLFDTGAQRNSISDIDILGGEEIFNDDNYNDLATIIGADGIKQSVGRYKTDSIVINIAKSKNLKTIIENVKLKLDCLENQSVAQGIYGIENFSESNKKILLDYENNVIKFTDIITDYKEVSAEFSRKQIHVNVTINNENHKLIFDTGNSSGILLTKNVLKDQEVVFSYSVLAKLVNDKLTVFNKKIGKIDRIASGDLNVEEIPITQTKQIRQNNMGLDFINKFNWIIDFQNEKLYAKRIFNKPFDFDNVSKNTSEFLVSPIDGELIVAFKKSTNQNINVGDIITKVNDEEVNNENICDLFEKLNKAENWLSFDISTKSMKE